jgi:hypothetical protein
LADITHIEAEPAHRLQAEAAEVHLEVHSKEDKPVPTVAAVVVDGLVDLAVLILRIVPWVVVVVAVDLLHLLLSTVKLL